MPLVLFFVFVFLSFKPLASWLGRLEKLNIFRSVWAERKVILDELDPEIRRNFERRGWLPLLEVEHPPPVALIREFYSNLSVHSNDSNIKFVKS